MTIQAYNQEIRDLLITKRRTMEITLPMIPTGVNHMYHTKQGKWYKDQKVKNWEEECLWLLKQNKTHVIGITEISIYFLFDNLRKNDIDGRIKPVLDVLQKAGIYEDDSLIDELHVYKRYTTDKPEIVIIA